MLPMTCRLICGHYGCRLVWDFIPVQVAHADPANIALMTAASFVRKSDNPHEVKTPASKAEWAEAASSRKWALESFSLVRNIQI